MELALLATRGEDSSRGEQYSKGPQEEVSWCPFKVQPGNQGGAEVAVQAEVGREQDRQPDTTSFEGTVRTLAFILWETGASARICTVVT